MIDDDDLLRGAVDGAVVYSVDDVVGVLTVNSAANRLGGAEHLKIRIRIEIMISIKITIMISIRIKFSKILKLE